MPALLQSEEAGRLLARVQGLINCPGLREVDDQLGDAGPGYDEVTRLLITGGSLPPVAEFFLGRNWIGGSAGRI